MNSNKSHDELYEMESAPRGSADCPHCSGEMLFRESIGGWTCLDCGETEPTSRVRVVIRPDDDDRELHSPRGFETVDVDPAEYRGNDYGVDDADVEIKAWFTFDDETYFEGYHVPNRRWNGFATPAFPLSELKAYQKIYGGIDGFAQITIDDDGRVWVVEAGYENEPAFELFPATVETVDGVRVLYGLGAYCWTWFDKKTD